MYVWRNIIARSCKYHRRGKGISITYSLCVCSIRYQLGNAHAQYCHPWPIRLCSTIPNYLINGKIFEKKKVNEHKMCILIFSTTFVWNICHYKKN